VGIILLGPSSTVSATDPVAPEPLYSLGADDYAHRWSADRIAGAVGSTVKTWPDAVVVGSDPLTYAGTIGTFTLGSDSGERVLKYASVASQNAIMQPASAGAPGKPLAVAVLMKIDVGLVGGAGTRYGAQVAGVTLSRASNQQHQVNGSGGYMLGGNAADQWVVMIFQYDGAATIQSNVNALLRVNDTETTAAVGTITPGTSRFALRSQAAVGGVSVENRYAEVVMWNRQLTQSERAGVVSAMRARYAFI
jgi:hypothetical protein